MSRRRPAPPASWTDEMSDEAMSLLSDADLLSLAERRAVLEERLVAQRSTAEMAAARRKLEADYAREVRALTAAAAERHVARDAQPAESVPQVAGGGGGSVLFCGSAVLSVLLRVAVGLALFAAVATMLLGADGAAQLFRLAGEGFGITLGGLGQMAGDFSSGVAAGSR